MMGFDAIKPVILWTDALIFLLVALVIGFTLYASRQEHLRSQWLQVIKNSLGMASLVVLLAYIVIGLLDSLHYREALPSAGNSETTHYSGEVLSAWDWVVGPIRTQVEKTYSEPFATHLYAKETVQGADGTEQRGYARLRYGAAHLEDPATQRKADIARRIVSAIGQTLIAGIVMVVLLGGLLARYHRRPFIVELRCIGAGRSEIAWRAGLVVSVVLLLLVLLAAKLGPYYHLFGTDKVGEDVFYQSLKSIRTGLVIGTLTTLMMLPFAILLGIMAGYFRGWVDDVIQYLYTTLNSIPGVLLIAAAILMLQVYMANHPDQFATTAVRADARLLFLCIILGVTSWTGLCRLLRGETLKLREVDYIQASWAFGVKNTKVILRHILPNVMHIVLITVVLDFSGLVLAEAVLSYVGVGVDPTMISWGNMINRARLEMAREPVVWWSLTAAFLFMFTLVLAANLFSDAVRDAFDPRLVKRS